MTEPLSPGTRAPDFALPNDGGGTTKLSDLKGRKVVLYFYPRADTPGCTREAIAFNALRRKFERADAVVLGVSADPVPAQDRFKHKYSLGFPLLSDEAKSMLKAYGAWGEKTLYGRKSLGVRRITYLIDSGGRIARVWPKVKVEGHAEEVLAAAESL